MWVGPCGVDFLVLLQQEAGESLHRVLLPALLDALCVVDDVTHFDAFQLLITKLNQMPVARWCVCCSSQPIGCEAAQFQAAGAHPASAQHPVQHKDGTLACLGWRQGQRIVVALECSHAADKLTEIVEMAKKSI